MDIKKHILTFSFSFFHKKNIDKIEREDDIGFEV